MNEGWWVLTGVLVGAISTGVFNLLIQFRQFGHEKEMFELRNRSAINVKALIKEMLSHKSFTDRSFSAIRNAIGGYSDDEVRQLLHEVGAKRTTRNEGKEEWWYLAERMEERIEKKQHRDNS